MSELIMKVTAERMTTGSIWKRFETVAELVRCKDCVYRTVDDGATQAECLLRLGYFPVKDEFYCADGKRRGNQDPG